MDSEDCNSGRGRRADAGIGPESGLNNVISSRKVASTALIPQPCEITDPNSPDCLNTGDAGHEEEQDHFQREGRGPGRYSCEVRQRSPTGGRAHSQLIKLAVAGGDPDPPSDQVTQGPRSPDDDLSVSNHQSFRSGEHLRHGQVVRHDRWQPHDARVASPAEHDHSSPEQTFSNLRKEFPHFVIPADQPCGSLETDPALRSGRQDCVAERINENQQAIARELHVSVNVSACGMSGDGISGSERQRLGSLRDLENHNVGEGSRDCRSIVSASVADDNDLNIFSALRLRGRKRSKQARDTRSLVVGGDHHAHPPHTTRHGPHAKVQALALSVGIGVLSLLVASCSTTTGTTPPSVQASNPATDRPPIGCIHSPSGCGYPDASNTGVKEGGPLRRVPQELTEGPGWVWDERGWLQVTSDRAVVENLEVTGSVEVAGRDVVLRNNKILASGETWGVGLRHSVNASIIGNSIGMPGTTPRLLVGIKDVYGDALGTVVTANNIAGASTGIQLQSGLIRDNYVHDLAMVDDDHVNGITSNGSTEQLVIDHNTVINHFNQTDAIGLFQDFGVEADRLITNNLLAGGAYTIYGGDNRRFGTTHGIRIVGNRISRFYFAQGGELGPLAAFDSNGTGNLWLDNIWDEDASPIP